MVEHYRGAWTEAGRKGAALTLLVRAPSMQVLIPNGSDGYRSRSRDIKPGRWSWYLSTAESNEETINLFWADDWNHNDGNWWCRPDVIRLQAKLERDFYDKPLALAYDASWYSYYDQIGFITFATSLRQRLDDRRRDFLSSHPIMKMVDWEELGRLSKIPAAPQYLADEVTLWVKELAGSIAGCTAMRWLKHLRLPCARPASGATGTARTAPTPMPHSVCCMNCSPRARRQDIPATGTSKGRGIMSIGRAFWVLGLVTLSAAFGAMARAEDEGPSFDCVAALTKDEIIICAALGHDDRSLAALFEEVAASLPEDRRTALAEDQRRWVVQRNAACGVSNDTDLKPAIWRRLVECFREQYRTRGDYLRTAQGGQSASPPALPPSKVQNVPEFETVWRAAAGDPQRAMEKLRTYPNAQARLYADILEHALSSESDVEFTKFAEGVLWVTGSVMGIVSTFPAR